ncbi:DNA adenine methylase [Streptomyces sp. NPDC059904]|uniref:DNA adenine methylase n=1 Tax=Streptomyces sp. NPDC059904 TaxID=3346996 RepID=UPI00364F1CD7
MKSPVPYFGSKQRLAPWIASLLPAHDHYVEPFCGGLSVLFAKRPAPMETVNDLDGELMTFWRVLRDQPTELIRACALTPHGREELAATWEPTEDDLELARRIWCRLAQGRSGTLRNTGWRHYIDPAGSSTSMPGYLEAYVQRLAAAAERLHGVSLEALPALDLIGKYGKQPKVLLYVDPPYLGTTRGWGNNYRCEMKTELEHRELAAALADCKATVVLSGYHSELYLELFDGWHRYEQSTMTGNAISDKGRTEVLWSNRVLAGQADLFAEVTA